MNGSIRKRGEKSWELTIDLGRDEHGKRLRKYVSVKGTKAEAQKKLRELGTAVDKGIPLDTSKATLAEFLEQWLEDYVATNTTPKTAEGYNFIVRCHLAPNLGHIPLNKLQPAHLQAYYSKALTDGRSDGTGGLSARTVLHHHRVLSEALSHAVKWGLLARNVADAVDPPRPAHTEIAVLSPDDVHRLLETAQETPYHALIFTAVYTGMRRGELLGLRWCDLDLDMATLSVVQSLQRLYGGKFVVKSPKSARGRRLIALPPSLAILLRKHKSQQREQRSLLGLPIIETDLVFSHHDGAPFDPSTISHSFSKMARKAGFPDVRFHDLRHTHASLMLRQGVHPKVVSERLGHATVSITLDVYSHVTPGIQAAAALSFEEVLQRPVHVEQGV